MRAEVKNGTSKGVSYSGTEVRKLCLQFAKKPPDLTKDHSFLEELNRASDQLTPKIAAEIIDGLSLSSLKNEAFRYFVLAMAGLYRTTEPNNAEENDRIVESINQELIRTGNRLEERVDEKTLEFIQKATKENEYIREIRHQPRLEKLLG